MVIAVKTILVVNHYRKII